MNTGRPAEVETQGVRDDGSTFAVKLRAFPICDSGGTPSGFIEVVEDITEPQTHRRRTHQSETGCRSRQPSQERVPGEHEPRDPHADDGHPRICRYPSGERRTRRKPSKPAEIIKRNGEHLLDLINDILDLSKIEAGKCTVELQTCSPSQIAAEVVSLMQVRADAKGLPLTLEVQGDIPEDDHDRSDPPAANPGQPRRQRHQVHRGRQRPGRHAAGRRFRGREQVACST